MDLPVSLARYLDEVYGMASPQVLYHHDQLDYYECLGCHELVEVPYIAVLDQGKQKQPVKANPENRLRWLELMTMDHQDCAAFADARKAKQHREYRRPMAAQYAVRSS